jgi:hypothetical protein
VSGLTLYLTAPSNYSVTRHPLIEQKKSPRSDSVLETYFVAMVYFISLLSLIALTMLSAGLFTPRNVALGAGLSGVVCAWSLRGRPFVGRLKRGEWGILAVLVVAVFFRSNPATFLNGGQDPGVYSAMAVHFARTGSLELHDTLLPDLRDDEGIRSYYLTRSMHRLREKRPNGWVGNMLPGVYLTDLERNQWDFQFYALHPMWLAIGNWMFGLQAQSWVLVIFSTLTVMSAYFITRRIIGSYAPALCAAFLLAINPGHAYFATFPVSETVAGFFFLSSLYLLLDKRFIGFLLPLAALFVTRITGFITAPLLLVSLGWMAARRRDSRPLWAGCGVLAVYVASFYWGLTFSPHYSFDIYKSKLGIERGSLHYAGWVFLGLGVVWGIVGYLVTRQRERFRGVLLWLSRYRYGMSGALVMVLLAMCAYRGYLVAFTDHYDHHRWYGARWKMAGHGWGSVRYLSVNTLRLLLSSAGLVAFFVGLVIVGAAACRRATLAPLAILGVGFAFVFLIGQLTTPITYYFARYLVSEVVPLAIICGVFALHSVRRSLPRGGWLLFPLFAACVLYSVWPALVGRLSATEGEGLSRAVECLDEVTGSNGVLLMDRQGLALGAYAYSTPLRLGFGKRVYTLAYSDFAAEPARLDALLSFFQRKNLEVSLLSSNVSWRGRSHFKEALILSITQERLFARRRLPTRFSKRKRTVRLYTQRPIDRIPPVCAQMAVKGRS